MDGGNASANRQLLAGKGRLTLWGYAGIKGRNQCSPGVSEST